MLLGCTDPSIPAPVQTGELSEEETAPAHTGMILDGADIEDEGPTLIGFADVSAELGIEV